MSRHDYKPKTTKPTLAEWLAEQNEYKRLMREAAILKSEHAANLKAIKKIMLAKKAWLIRYQTHAESLAKVTDTNISTSELAETEQKIFSQAVPAYLRR